MPTMLRRSSARLQGLACRDIGGPESQPRVMARTEAPTSGDVTGSRLTETFARSLARDPAGVALVAMRDED